MVETKNTENRQQSGKRRRQLEESRDPTFPTSLNVFHPYHQDIPKRHVHRLANAHIQANGCRVRVLEVVQSDIAVLANLNRNLLASKTGSASNVNVVAGPGWLNRKRRGFALVVPCCLPAGGFVEHTETERTVTGICKGASFKLPLFGQEEDEGACLTGMVRMDVEVEDAVHPWSNGAIE